jgi:hypothetical protein
MRLRPSKGCHTSAVSGFITQGSWLAQNLLLVLCIAAALSSDVSHQYNNNVLISMPFKSYSRLCKIGASFLLEGHGYRPLGCAGCLAPSIGTICQGLSRWISKMKGFNVFRVSFKHVLDGQASCSSKRPGRILRCAFCFSMGVQLV